MMLLRTGFWVGTFIFSLGADSLLDLHRSSHFPKKMLPCQTACHQAETMSNTHKQKRQSAKCTVCHFRKTSILSPFNSIPRLKTITAVPKLSPNRIMDPKSISMHPSKVVGQTLPKKMVSKAPPNMVYIPPGDFIMGSNDRWDDEAPEFIAVTEAYFIDLYEVTNRDYRIYIAETGTEHPFHWPGGKINKSQLDHPVIYVNWFEAANYCQWAGKRLPTEKEWEKAARGVEGNIYPWGNDWDLNKSNNPYAHSTGTKPVGSYADGRSPYGLYDMSGNVWEWVDSYYLPHPGNMVSRPEYGKKNRVLKGGSWFDCLSYGCGLSAPTFNRSFFTPEVRNNSFGFRCSKSVDNPTVGINNSD